MQKYSDQQIAEQIATLLNALKVPNIPADEAAMHRNLIARLESELQRRQAQQPPAPRPSPPPPAEPNPIAERPPMRPVSESLVTGVGVEPRSGILSPVKDRTANTSDSVATEVFVIAEIGKGGKVATIQWADGSSSTLSEGAARSRFSSALRDLCESTYAQQERFGDLIYYRTWHRAVGYYSALAALWGRQPSARELDLLPMSRVRATVLQMIQDQQQRQQQ